MAEVGLVLGAGGLVGHAFHAGVLRALAAHGWDARQASVIVGTSAGSGVAAVLRAGLPPQDIAARVTGEPLSAEGRRLLADAPPPASTLSLPPPVPTWPGGWPRPASPELLWRAATRWWRARPGHLVAGALPPGRHPTDHIGERIRRLYRGSDRWPDEPLWICTLRLRDGCRVVLGRDPTAPVPVATAVEASSAIPGYFRPVEIGGERYVDGGAHSPTNADLLADLGLDVLIVVSPMSIAASAPRTPTTAGRWWWHRQVQREVAPARRTGTRVLVIEPTTADLAAMGHNARALDARAMPEVARQAERSTAQVLSREAPLG